MRALQCTDSCAGDWIQLSWDDAWIDTGMTTATRSILPARSMLTSGIYIFRGRANGFTPVLPVKNDDAHSKQMLLFVS